MGLLNDLGFIVLFLLFLNESSIIFIARIASLSFTPFMQSLSEQLFFLQGAHFISFLITI